MESGSGPGALPCGDLQGRHTASFHIDEAAVVPDFAMTEQPRQQRQSLVCQNLIYERLLSFKGLNGTARGEIVIFVQFWIRNFWEELDHGWQAKVIPAIPDVPGLSKDELSSIRCVPQIKPIGAVSEEW